ncbi:MAG: hypothetical protein KAS48_09950 [Gammaproteobacteria bacterium]|nr:hypothetical protein [Gammaproteobacteria bacterium]
MMKKLNSYKLLLVFVFGFLANPQSIWADDDINKPDSTVIAGQYSVSDNFEGLGKPADIGC